MAMQQTQRPLHDIKILVTRPQQRAGGLCESIAQAGGTALQFAAIEINEPADSQSREYARDHIAEFTLAIFISPTAVEKTLEYLSALPADIQISAIGSRTAKALITRGLDIAIIPDGHDSESLLEHPQMQAEQVSGQKIIIFRGEDGRELLGDTLRSRGAEVFYADMYQRSPPPSATQLDQYLEQADIITVSSNQGLQNLYDLATDKGRLTSHYLVVPGERGFMLAKALGFSNIFVAENATDEACMNALEYALAKMSKKS
jgi:uroporphyrinogen-III synthase